MTNYTRIRRPEYLSVAKVRNYPLTCINTSTHLPLPMTGFILKKIAPQKNFIRLSPISPIEILLIVLLI